MSLFQPSADDHELIERITELFAHGAHLAIEMLIEKTPLTFDEWATRLRTNPRLSKDVATITRLIWVWDTLRDDPELSIRFIDLPPATSIWSRHGGRINVLEAGEWFAIGLNNDAVVDLLQRREKAPWGETVAVRINEQLQMRPGKADRLECCGCDCEVLIRADELYPVDREADIMGTTADRIVLEPKIVRVRVDSLNQAYTVARRRLEPTRPNASGSIYEHLVYIRPEARVSLEEIRQQVENGTWKVPAQSKS